MKTCTKCGKAKPLADFGRHKKSRDGLYQRCLPCARADRREAAARAMSDPDRAAAVRKRQAEWATKWRRANPEEASRKARSQYYRDLERSRIQSRESEARRRKAKPSEVREIRRRSYSAIQRATNALADNSGRPWSEADDATVLDQTRSLRERAFALGRSLAATRARESVLRGRIDPLAQERKDFERTRPHARRWGRQWTGPELELAADYSRSSVELALLLGRTAGAVEHQRGLIRKDPRKARLAGVLNP